eukprot:1181039-Prorocentrum_minimum.AAC.1
MATYGVPYRREVIVRSRVSLGFPLRAPPSADTNDATKRARPARRPSRNNTSVVTTHAEPPLARKVPRADFFVTTNRTTADLYQRVSDAAAAPFPVGELSRRASGPPGGSTQKPKVLAQVLP